MKKLALCALLLCGLATCVLTAQQAATVDRPAEPNFLFDDDGGKVQIVPADLALAGTKTFHGGAVLGSARQVSLFLGAGWGDQQFRSRQLPLLDIAAGQGPHRAELQQHGITTLRSTPRFEDFSDLSRTPVNDLAIQRKLRQVSNLGADGEGAASIGVAVSVEPNTTLQTESITRELDPPPALVGRA